MKECFVLVVASLLGPCTQAFSPRGVPITWMGSKQQIRVLIPKDFKIHSGVSPPPQLLTTMDPLEDMTPDAIPRFQAKPDGAIGWDKHMDWCIEASGGARSGSAVRVNWCDGRPDQKWNWIPESHGRHRIQLKDTNKCLGKDGLDAATIVLSECSDIATATWKLEEFDFHPSQIRVEKAGRQSTMRHLIISMLALAGIGAVGLAASFRQKSIGARREALTLTGTSSKIDAEGGISLISPLAMQKKVARHGSVISQLAAARQELPLIAVPPALDKPADISMPLPQVQGDGGNRNPFTTAVDSEGYHMRMLNEQEQDIVLEHWKKISKLFGMTGGLAGDEAVGEMHGEQLQRIDFLSYFADFPRGMMALFKDAPELEAVGTLTDKDQVDKVKVVLGTELHFGVPLRVNVQHMAFYPFKLHECCPTAELIEKAIAHVDALALGIESKADLSLLEGDPYYSSVAECDDCDECDDVGCPV